MATVRKCTNCVDNGETVDKASLKKAGVIAILGLSGTANALTVDVVDSLTTPSPFGVGFDGTNVFFSTPFAGIEVHKINQNAAGMPITGSAVTLSAPGVGGGGLGFDGTHFVTAASGKINYFNTDGSLFQQVSTPASGGVIDGLDFDHGEVWYSPDAGAVFRLDAATGAFIGANPVLSRRGGFSGVERIDAAGSSFLLVANDVISPRNLCRTSLDGVFDPVKDCAILSDRRYHDLAFDGQFLYAADLAGNRIDKIDLAAGGFIPGPGGVPEPATAGLLALGLAGIAALRRRKYN